MTDEKYAELRAQVVALVTDVYDRAAQIDETADAVLDLIPTHRADAIATRVCHMVAELPDRNSPAEWPEAMLVTHEELRSIVLGALNDDQPAPQPAAQQGDTEDRIARLTAEAHENKVRARSFEQDAARYRWLRDYRIGNDPVLINLRRAKRAELDAAIDAAMGEGDA